MDTDNAETSESLPIKVIADFAHVIEENWPGSWELLDFIDDMIWDIEESLEAVGEASRSEFHRVPEYIRRDVGYLPLFELAELTQASLHLVIEQSETTIPKDVRYVFVGLTVRAISTLREIAILLENGYAFGAKARWRTLSEILVVARVLLAGTRYTATRYKEHRWVMLAKERDQTHDLEWVDDAPTPEIMRAKLCRRFGKSFRYPYGWAEKVVSQEIPNRKPGSKPTWEELKTIANVDFYEPGVQDAHHSVHADALGFLGTVDHVEGLFRSGASSQEVLEVSQKTVRLFREVMWSLFANCTRYTKNRQISILQATVEVHTLNWEAKLGHQILLTNQYARERYHAVMSELFGRVRNRVEDEAESIEQGE